MDWIKDKDRCWMCGRTRQEVLDDSHPDGNLLPEDESKQIDVVFTERITTGTKESGLHYPICMVCEFIIGCFISDYLDDRYYKDELFNELWDRFKEKLDKIK